jgi:glutathione synthase
MDPLQSIKPAKDSTLAMLLEAQKRGWSLHYMEMGDLWLQQGRCLARTQALRVRDDAEDWFELGESRHAPLAGLDVVLMRKDPPFDIEYVYATQLLELAEREGLLVVNRPAALRDANEKLFATWFPELTPATLVTRQSGLIRDFLAAEKDIILKPLGGMGGSSIFRIQQGDPNTSVIIETLTAHGSQYTMAQAFLPAIADGDKRILMVDGEPVPWMLARIPAQGESRGNLAAGGLGEPRLLGQVEADIARAVGPRLREMGILFAGLDVIGDRLTEINITSPTCIRELDRAFDCNIAAMLMDVIANRLDAR